MARFSPFPDLPKLAESPASQSKARDLNFAKSSRRGGAKQIKGGAWCVCVLKPGRIKDQSLVMSDDELRNEEDHGKMK